MSVKNISSAILGVGVDDTTIDLFSVAIVADSDYNKRL